MPRVKFTQDFQGVETREAFYKKGQEVDLPDSMAERLLKDGRVEKVAGGPHKIVAAEPETPEQIVPVSVETAVPEAAPETEQEAKPKRLRRKL